MSNEQLILFLFSAFILGGAVFSIYILKKEEKLEKEMREEEEKRQLEYDEMKKNQRQEYSYEWNKIIQSKFKDSINYTTNRPIKVLVGDYSKTVASITNSALKGMGIETEFVPTASDVIDRINDNNEYDVIITNNVYPDGESGFDVLYTLKKKKDFNTPIVILTVDQNARKEYLYYGYDEYIPKPLDEKKVKEVLPKLIKDLKFKKIKSNNSK